MAEPRFIRDYDRRRPIVRDYDREDSMSDGFEELGPRSLLPNPRRLKYAVDGEVPEILYTLNHVNQSRRFLGRKLRTPLYLYNSLLTPLAARLAKLQTI